MDGWQQYLVLVLVSAFSVVSRGLIPNTGFLYSATQRERERITHREKARERRTNSDLPTHIAITV
jgi:hypothetical protein